LEYISNITLVFVLKKHAQLSHPLPLPIGHPVWPWWSLELECLLRLRAQFSGS